MFFYENGSLIIFFLDQSHYYFCFRHSNCFVSLITFNKFALIFLSAIALIKSMDVGIAFISIIWRTNIIIVINCIIQKMVAEVGRHYLYIWVVIIKL